MLTAQHADTESGDALGGDDALGEHRSWRRPRLAGDPGIYRAGRLPGRRRIRRAAKMRAARNLAALAALDPLIAVLHRLAVGTGLLSCSP